MAHGCFERWWENCFWLPSKLAVSQESFGNNHSPKWSNRFSNTQGVWNATLLIPSRRGCSECSKAVPIDKANPFEQARSNEMTGRSSSPHPFSTLFITTIDPIFGNGPWESWSRTSTICHKWALACRCQFSDPNYSSLQDSSPNLLRGWWIPSGWNIPTEEGFVG